MNMCKQCHTSIVYVVTSGEYSDYGIQAIFDERTAAEVFIRCLGEYSEAVIEEWPLNDSVVGRFWTSYLVVNVDTGEVISEMTGMYQKAMVEHLRVRSIVEGPNRGHTLIDVYGEGRAQALRVAHDRRAQILAEREGSI